MKIDKLKEIFKNFYCNNDRAILIDGVWGVGKTHTILEFLESLEFCKTRVPFSAKYKYVSLFGKSNIDEIHTEIYRQFHPNYSLEDKQNYFTDNTKSKLNPAIEDFFKKSNYFINDLIGEISISQWHLANTMVLYSSKFCFQDELKKHIKALKSTDKSSAIRYETLLKSL